MNIEIIAIGNEVLAGFTINSNAAFIAQELLKIGLKVTKQTVLADDPNYLKEGLTEAINCNQLVITTGGLGPTCDDMTRTIAAELFHSDFRYDKEIAAELESRYGKMLPSLQDQATVPSKAIILRNHLGTAPGFIFQKDKSLLVLLPGVPPEMKAMFIQEAIPFLDRFFQPREQDYRRSLHFFDLPENAVDPYLRQLQKENPAIQFGIYPALGMLSVHLSIASSNHNQAMRLLNPHYEALKKQFEKHFLEIPTGKLEEAVQQSFIEKKLTLSVAESCTGGAIAARLTQVPGASNYFLGSIVAYSNQVKIDVLGVPKEIIEAHGAVSPEVVSVMAQGVNKALQSDYSVAVSGVAGPGGGTLKKPVGTVYAAILKRGEEPFVWKIAARGTRQMIIEYSVNSILGHLLAGMR